MSLKTIPHPHSKYTWAALIIFLIMLFVGIGYQINLKWAGKQYLKRQGFSEVKMLERQFFKLGMCTNHHSRVNFKAIKNNQEIKGYVCLSALWWNEYFID